MSVTPLTPIARTVSETSAGELASSQSNAIPFNHQASSDSNELPSKPNRAIVSPTIPADKTQQAIPGYSIPYNAMREY